MSSDYFIVPTAPDYFSLLAIDSLANILPKWVAWATKASKMEALSQAVYPFPEPKLKFLGSIIQKYRPMKGKDGRLPGMDRRNQFTHSRQAFS
jgi:hypothetical protein